MSGQPPQDKPDMADGSSDRRVMAPSKGHDYTDNRPRWDWPTKYPSEARTCINREAFALAAY